MILISFYMSQEGFSVFTEHYRALQSTTEHYRALQRTVTHESLHWVESPTASTESSNGSSLTVRHLWLTLMNLIIKLI